MGVLISVLAAIGTILLAVLGTIALLLNKGERITNDESDTAFWIVLVVIFSWLIMIFMAGVAYAGIA